jgi:hypothetical protein
VERFADGAWLCDGVLLREGEAAQPLGAELTAVAGQMVWTFSGGRVGRLAGVLSDATIDVGLSSARALLASESDVLVIHPSGVVRVALDGQGGLTETGRIERTIAQDAAVRRVGDSLVIGELLVPFVLGMDPSAPAAPRGVETQVCLISVRGGEITQRGCRRYAGRLLGESDEGVIILGELFQIRAVKGELGDGVTLTLPPPFARTVTPSPRGIVRFGSGAIAKHIAGALWLQSYEGVTGASGALVWSAGESSTLVWRR